VPKPYVYYDRRDLTATETQFFHESRTKVADKEIQTNMELDAQFPSDFHIKKILVIIPPTLLSSTTQKDATLDDQLQILLKEGVIEIQVGTGQVEYYPLALALGGPDVRADLEYTQGTAADGSYAFLSVGKGVGLDVDIPVPARTDFKFFIKTKSTPSISGVGVYLIGEKA